MQKLDNNGARNNILEWIKDILSQLTQEVIIDGAKYSVTSVTPGVPQGTVLVPYGSWHT